MCRESGGHPWQCCRGLARGPTMFLVLWLLSVPRCCMSSRSLLEQQQHSPRPPSLSQGTTPPLLATFPEVAAPDSTADLPVFVDIDAFNYGLGTQQINPKYGFTRYSAIREAAQVIKTMGSNIIKLHTDITKYSQTVTTVNGINFKSPTTTLTQLVSLHPDMKQVFDDSYFKFIFLWAYTRANLPLQGTFQGFDGNTTALDEEYRQIFDLTTYLLKRYQNTGKTFFLGNWEGDGHLLVTFQPPVLKADRGPNGMIDWYNTRQRAIDDAKRATIVYGVEVYGYLELNQPRLAMGSGSAPCVCNLVLPFCNPDFVSYSAYDSLENSPELRQANSSFETFGKTIRFLQDMLPKKSLTNRLNPSVASPYASRVFVGEYGFFQGPTAKNSFSPSEAAKMTIAFARAAFTYQLPFMLYWQLYNNAMDNDGSHHGWWLIDNNNVKQPVYYVHNQFYKKAKSYVIKFKAENRRVPTAQEYSEAAVAILDTLKVA